MKHYAVPFRIDGYYFTDAPTSGEADADCDSDLQGVAWLLDNEAYPIEVQSWQVNGRTIEVDEDRKPVPPPPSRGSWQGKPGTFSLVWVDAPPGGVAIT